MPMVLIVDDDPALCRLIASVVGRLGHESVCSYSLERAMEQAAQAFDAVFLDVNLPDGNGLHAIAALRAFPCAPEVIIMTGAGDPQGAELAIRSGAWDYVEKPLLPSGIELHLQRVLQYRKSLMDARKTAVSLQAAGILGASAKMKACFDALAHTAQCEGAVLITGETGTGKELFARAVHQNSSRADRSFVVVDCAALPETLAESTLFGHEKGAFTGAERAREGLIKQADRGTLFLDEVGELSVPLQKAFLRVLQEKRFRPIGAGEEGSSDFRLVAATNRDLDRMAASGQFRKDLLYRIRGMVIELPPLRERTEDIKELALHHSARLCDKYGIETKGFSSDFFPALQRYEWPGNVRELFHAIESALVEAGGEPILFPKHLPGHIRIRLVTAGIEKKAAPAPVPLPSPGCGLSVDGRLAPFQSFRDSVLGRAEKTYFKELIAFTNGNIHEACRVSGLGRSRLYSIIKKHDLSRVHTLSA